MQMIETKLYRGSQTVVPSAVKKALNVDDDCIFYLFFNCKHLFSPILLYNILLKN